MHRLASSRWSIHPDRHDRMSEKQISALAFQVVVSQRQEGNTIATTAAPLTLRCLTTPLGLERRVWWPLRKDSTSFTAPGLGRLGKSSFTVIKFLKKDDSAIEIMPFILPYPSPPACNCPSAPPPTGRRWACDLQPVLPGGSRGDPLTPSVISAS